MQYQNVIIKINLGSSRDIYFEFEPKELGRYLLLPCTEKGLYSTEYLLRVFSNSRIHLRFGFVYFRNFHFYKLVIL
jgi:hypothetical protein